MNNMKWLELWYKQNCDGYWEHFYGVKIETMDNPGWSVEINFSQMDYELEIDKYEKDEGDDNWIVCSMENGCFKGFGDSLKLDEIIGIFKQNIEKYDSRFNR